ncbi:MAG: asparagine synthase (glutamine-hydrolyzing) [Alphaproteobacteria bacterium]
MCGIAGFLEPAASAGQAAMRAVAGAMAERLTHRGPDANGVWCDTRAGIALGFRRLAIVDLSPAGNQPMNSKNGRYTIVFNGEIYNYRELKTSLEQAGTDGWRGASDTEIMLEAFARWGLEETLKSLNGMFAIALWDRRERTLTLARDRIGEKPLYYGWSGRSFLFGSELKALAAHPAWRGEIDRGALSLLLRYDYIPGPYSIFENVAKLPPGHFLQIEAGEAVPGTIPSPQAYWSAGEAARRGAETPFQGGEEEAVEALDALLRDSIARRLEADVPVGVFLSGGIDSASVTGIAQAVSSQPVKTFSIGFEDPRLDEAPQAAAVARHLGTEHTELYATEAEALATVPDLPVVYDEPFADVSQIPTLILSRLTRRHVTVGLSGDGGDELFCGYPRYRRVAREWRRIAGLPGAVRRGAGGLSRAVPAGALDSGLGWMTAIAGPRRRWGRPGSKLRRRLEGLAVGDAMSLYRRHLIRWQGAKNLVPGGQTYETAYDREGPADALGTVLDQAMYRDAIAYLPDDILVKVDRASMAASLEARAPLLDHRLVEFAWSLPASMKLRRDAPHREQSKWILRQVLKRYVPEALTDRPKSGFDPPLGEWLRGSLRDWAEALLAPERMAREGFIDPAPVERCWREHTAGGRNRRHELWGVLSFQAWLERWGAESSQASPPKSLGNG